MFVFFKSSDLVGGLKISLFGNSAAVSVQTGTWTRGRSKKFCVATRSSKIVC